MCCFTRPVERVEQTRIYARAEDDRQLVVYELKLLAHGELAMVLPIPVARRDEGAIAFVDLTSSPAFFRALEYAFRAELGPSPQSRAAAPAHLAVHRVGAFDASFVPRAIDFDRLDPRFAISSALWSTVTDVRDYGFVVFKLRDATGDRRALRTFHPMAFWFPRADRTRVFFPTLHVHDGRVHESADFDHVLYAQTDAVPEGWDRSPHPFHEGVGGDGRNLVLPVRGHRRVMKGRFPNRDVWIDS